MFWFRVELDAAGKLIKSEQVAESGERDGRPSVYYFRAPAAESAESMAYREYHRTRLAARRLAYQKQGNCRCGRSRAGETKADSVFKLCPACRALDKRKHIRTAARAKGLPVVPPPSKAEHFVDRRNEEKRLLLEEVREQFLRLNVRPFGEWLNARIAELEPKQAPRLRVVGGSSGRR